MSFRASLVTLLAALALTTPALADNHIALPRFDPAQAGDSFFGVAAPPSDIQNLALRSRLTLDYANDPLVLRSSSSDSLVEHVVKRQFIANLGVTVDFKKRFSFSLDVPIALSQASGSLDYDLQRANGAHIGDFRVAARARVFELNKLARLSLAAFVFAPIGHSDSSSGVYMSDGHMRGRFDVIAHGDNGKYVWSFAVGPEFRASNDFFTVHQGTALAVAAGFGVRFFDNRLQVGPEARGVFTLSESSKYNRNIEALFGVRYYRPIGLTGGIGAGPGFSSGVGTPDYRIVATLGYAFSFDKPKAAPEPLPVPAPVDSDNDGVDDEHDACKDVPGPVDNKGCPIEPPPAPVPAPAPVVVPPPDRDNDGVVDARDACVEVPGPAENDGCPAAAPEPTPEPAAKVVGDQIVILQQIQFETGSDVIRGESVPTMEAILAAVNSLPVESRFVVEGFTDSRGSVKSNEKLSNKRAKAVAKWLGAHGIAAERFTTAGLGPSRPIQSNDTEEGRKANRRVEIHIIK